MQPPTEDRQNRDTFIALAQRISAYKPQDLIRRELGAINFEHGLPLFTQITAFFAQVGATPIDHVPIETVLECLRPMGQLETWLKRVAAFSVLGNDPPVANRDNTLANLDATWRQCYAAVTPHLTYETLSGGPGDVLAVLRGEVAELKKGMKEDADAAKQASSATVKEMQANLQTSERLLATMQENAQKRGVTREAVNFKSLADWYRTLAVIWLVVALLTGLGTYKYLAQVLAISPVANQSAAPTASPPAASGSLTQSDYVSLFKTMLPRLIIITLLLTALLFCLRNFSAMSHNSIVNRHRQTALTTFETFVDATHESEVKNAVLLQATQAIFSPQPSGYLKGESEAPQVNLVADTVRSITAKGSKD